MTCLEEQESSTVDPNFDSPADVRSYYPLLRDSGITAQNLEDNQSRRRSDDRTSNPDGGQSELEIKHDSLAPIIGDTLLVLLDSNAQDFDKSTSLSPAMGHLLQPLSTVTTTAVGGPPTKVSFISAFELATDVDVAEEAKSGFTYGKASKPVAGQFSRPHGKIIDVGPISQTTDIMDAASVMQSQSFVQPASLPEISKMEDGQAEISANCAHNESIGASEVNDHRRGYIGYSKNPHTSNELGPKVHKDERQDPQPYLSFISADSDSSIPNLVPHLAESLQRGNHQYSPSETPIAVLGPQKVDKRAIGSTNKSHKRLGISKQPFPEVVELSAVHRLKGNEQMANACHNLSASNLKQSIDVINSSYQDNFSTSHESTSSRINNIDQENSNGQFRDVVNAKRHRRPQSISGWRSNPDPVQQPSVDQTFHYMKEHDCQPAVIRSDTAATSHCEERQCDSANLNQMNNREFPGGLETVVAEHRSLPEQQSPSPRSRHNNSRTMSRPMAARDLLPLGLSDSNSLMRVKKSKSTLGHLGQGISTNSEDIEKPQHTASIMSDFRVFIQNAVAFEEIAKHYEIQKDVVQSQRLEIEKLNDSRLESWHDVKRLEGEKETLTQKLKKLIEISTKYKAHMNEVVVAQKYLMAQSSRIQRESAEIRDESKGALQLYAERESHIQKLQRLIEEAKDFRAPSEKMENLLKENENCRSQVERLSSTNELLQSDLNRRMVELGRERHNGELLQKHLEAQSAAHKELVETLKSMQLCVVDELKKDGGVLASILKTENSIQTKIDELITPINTLNSREQDIQPALTNLIEDLYTRIEIRLQATDQNDAVQNETSFKLFEDLKDHINQLHLDQDANRHLNDRITELRESNAALTAAVSCRELDYQAMTKRVDELGQELSGCRDQLRTKCDELVALRAAPKDDPILRSKIHDLEEANTVLHEQLHAAKQESSKAEEDARAFRETSFSTLELIQELEGKLNDAKTVIKSFAEEKKKQLAAFKIDIKKAREDVAKAANASKTEMRMRNDALVKNLEQRRSEAETQLRFANEELQRIQTQNESDISNLNKIRAEISDYKEQFMQQSVQIKHLEEHSPRREDFERRENNLQKAVNEIAELQLVMTAMQIEAAEGRQSDKKDIEDHARKVDALEKDKGLLEEYNLRMRKRYESLRDGVTRYLLRGGMIAPGQSVDDWADTIPVYIPHKMEPPAVPVLKLANSRLSASPSCDLTLFTQGCEDNEAIGRSHPGTPKEALKRNLIPGSATSRLIESQPSTLAEVRGATFDTTKSVHGSGHQSLHQPLRTAFQKSETKEILSIRTGGTQNSATTPESNETQDLSLTVQTPPNIAPFSTLTPVATSSPLTNIESIIDHLESITSQEELQNVYEGTKCVKIVGTTEGNDITHPQAFAANTSWYFTRAESTIGNQLARLDGWPSGKIRTQNAPQATTIMEESSRRRQSKPLKSALKASCPGQGLSSTLASKDSALKLPPPVKLTVPAVTAAPKQSRSSSRNINKTRPQTNSGSIRSSYNRVASGVIASARNPRPRGQPIEERQAVPTAQTNTTQKSPMMGAPRRNARKRTISSILEAEAQSAKPTKAPRLSFAPHITQKVIPDSQEAPITTLL